GRRADKSRPGTVGRPPIARAPGPPARRVMAKNGKNLQVLGRMGGEDQMDPISELLGDSPVVEDLRARARRLLAGIRDSRRVPLVLIRGETGTGKNLLARALHNASSR